MSYYNYKKIVIQGAEVKIYLCGVTPITRDTFKTRKKKSSLDIGVQDMKVKNGKVEGQFVPVWPKASLLHDDVRRGYSVVYNCTG